MGVLIAIDPSVRGTGLAVYRNRFLESTALWEFDVRVNAENYGTIAAKAYAQAYLWVASYIHGPLHVAEAICEVPQIYRKGPGDANDLIAVAMVGAAVLAGIYPVVHEKVYTVWPGVWKGQVPKRVHHARIQSKLTEAENAILADAKRTAGAGFHNVLDAVGLGLWWLEKRDLRDGKR